MAPFRSKKGTRGFPRRATSWATRMESALVAAFAKRGFSLGSGHSMGGDRTTFWKGLIRRGTLDTTGEIEFQAGWKYRIILRCWASPRHPGHVEWEAVAPKSRRFAPRRTAARAATAYARWAASMAVKDVMGA